MYEDMTAVKRVEVFNTVMDETVGDDLVGAVAAQQVRARSGFTAASTTHARWR